MGWLAVVSYQRLRWSEKSNPTLVTARWLPIGKSSFAFESAELNKEFCHVFSRLHKTLFFFYSCVMRKWAFLMRNMHLYTSTHRSGQGDDDGVKISQFSLSCNNFASRIFRLPVIVSSPVNTMRLCILSKGVLMCALLVSVCTSRYCIKKWKV